MTATGDQSVPREERVLLAVRAYQQGQFKSTRKAAAAYDVPQSTVSDLGQLWLGRRAAPMPQRCVRAFAAGIEVRARGHVEAAIEAAK
ncbi:helix-turn-helix, psq domain-containing protein [Hirsutella rhossiliensis]